ncbi:uncharacterized protein N7459_000375 [Penicillium hispanicum]|uniref:uncharacterized protein n=1 Tax=Penicillium hispanicum TaxID=1080232 RepID=UPI0025413046|nr:uncharacterized protein N7459_000375 [Penicillium hispanicum]KAJ5594167.1 hypothetical protein N7459_000375 [Penicillium hispanicum]
MRPSRQRVKRACETCKVRKRKCDGREPCGFCLRYEYDCGYGPQTRRKTNEPQVSGSVASSTAEQHGSRSSTEHPVNTPGLGHQHRGESSGAAFPRMVGLELNQADAPRVYGVSWNLGLREEPAPCLTSITALLSVNEMQSLAHAYLVHIHPVYGILDSDSLKSEITSRWQNPSAAADYDSILCGVAALGSLYSGDEGHLREGDLFKCARELLEISSIMRRPTLHHAVAWVLRTLYLRSTNSPHASWMASCTTIHVIEATETRQDHALETTTNTTYQSFGMDEETRRRLIWVALKLNAWISFEYGRPRVSIKNVLCDLPSPRDKDFTDSLIQLYQISDRLDPDHHSHAADLQESLGQIENLVIDHDVVTLSRANLALAIYRNLRVTSIPISSDVLACVIRLGNTGLDAAVRLGQARQPWWHVANVPFQYICTLLAIDSRESLSNVGHALRSFKTIGQYFHTRNLQQAVETAEFLVRLSQRRKKSDLDALNEGLDDVPIWDLGQDTSLDTMSLNWDWDAFLQADIPLFDEHLYQR